MKIGAREAVFVALLMGIPLAAWFMVYRPQSAQAQAVRKEIDAKQQRLRELNLATGTIGDLRDRISRLQEAMDFFRTKLPSEKEIDKVLHEVWLLAETNSLRTRSIRTLDRSRAPGGAAMGGDYCEQLISVQLEGNFMGFYGFLQALENQPRIMRIHKMQLSKPRSGAQGEVQAEFVMTVFFEGAEAAK